MVQLKLHFRISLLISIDIFVTEIWKFYAYFSCFIICSRSYGKDYHSDLCEIFYKYSKVKNAQLYNSHL